MTLIEAVKASGPNGAIRRPGTRAGDWLPCKWLPNDAPGGGYAFLFDECIADDWEPQLPEAVVTRSQLESAVQVVIGLARIGAFPDWPQFTRDLAKELGI